MALYQMPDGQDYEFSSDEEASLAMSAWQKQFAEPAYGVGGAIAGGVGAALDFVAPANLAIPGLIEGARTLMPESLGGISTEQAAKNITEGSIPGTDISYAEFQPTKIIERFSGEKFNKAALEQANKPLHALTEMADYFGTKTLESSDSPALATISNIAAATLALGGATHGAAKGSKAISDRFQNKPLDPKMEAAKAESDALKMKEEQAKKNETPIEFEPEILTEWDVPKKAEPQMPGVEFALEPKTPTRPLYNELETPLGKAEPVRTPVESLGTEVDVSGVRNPYFQGDRKANVEVDSVSGRPIFPEDATISTKPLIDSATGKEIAGQFRRGENGYYINPEYIANLWFKLKDSTKEKLGLKRAEDLQDFVEMHERQHWFDDKETGRMLRDGETIFDAEKRINRIVKEQRDPLMADDSVAPLKLPEGFREPYEGPPKEIPLREETKSPAEFRAEKEKLERALDSVNKKLAELDPSSREFTGDYGTANIAKLDNYRKVLESRISQMQDAIARGRKMGFSFEPKSRKKPQAGPGGKQGGAVNFGVSEKIVDAVKKLTSNLPSLKTFAEQLGRDTNDPVVAQLYEKYYGKEVKSFTPQEAAIAKIPGLKETISPELQPLDTMLERWRTETDLSSAPLAKALRENLSSGGRMTAARTGNSFIDWHVENVLGETRRAQVITKKIQNDIRGEVNKLTGSLMSQIRGKTEGTKLFVEAMTALLKAEGKPGAIKGVPPEAAALVKKIQDAHATLGKLVEAELASQGIPGFKLRANYLAGVFFGPYRSLVRDASGEVIGVVAGRTKAEATAAIDHVKENMPDVSFELVEYNPKFDQGPGSLGARYGKASEVLELLKNQSESAKLLQENLNGYYTKVQENYMGYKHHFKKKKGVFGSEGTRPWENARNNALDLLEAQLGVIDHGYHWLAEQKLMKDINKSFLDSEIALPESKQYVAAYLDHAFGRTEDKVKIFSEAQDLAAQTLGISPSSFREMSSIARNTALTGTLGVSGGFVLTQLVQVPQALSVGFARAIDSGVTGGNRSGSAIMGGMDLVHGIAGKLENMSDAGRYFFNHFTKNGVMDPHLIEHTIHRKIVTTTGMSPIQKAVWGSVNGAFKGAELLSGLIGKYSIERPEAWTRGTFAMTMAHYYRSAGYSLKEAAIRADKDTSVLFVDYSMQERAMMFQRMGELGKFASTVSTFKMNNLNQWFTFSNKKMYTALTALALTSWFTTGLVGMPFGDEAEFGATYLKSKGVDIPTPREFALRELPDWLSFGPLSSIPKKAGELVGNPNVPAAALHRKFAQDNVIPDDLASFIYPLSSFYTNKIKTGSDWVKSGFAGQEGAVFARELVPGNLKYGVDYLGLTNEKGLTIDPNQIHDVKPSHYNRTKQEWKLAAALGVLSQREWADKQYRQLDKMSEMAWKESTKSMISKTISAYDNKNQAKFEKLAQEAIKYNPGAAEEIVKYLQGRAEANNLPMNKMMEIQFASGATSPHGVKRLQGFQQFQENRK